MGKTANTAMRLPSAPISVIASTVNLSRPVPFLILDRLNTVQAKHFIKIIQLIHCPPCKKVFNSSLLKAATKLMRERDKSAVRTQIKTIHR